MKHRRRTGHRAHRPRPLLAYLLALAVIGAATWLVWLYLP